MHMHERLGDTTYEEADEDIPNEVKHVSCISGRLVQSHANFASVTWQRFKWNDEARMTKEGKKDMLRLSWFASMQRLSECPNSKKKLHGDSIIIRASSFAQ